MKVLKCFTLFFFAAITASAQTTLQANPVSQECSSNCDVHNQVKAIVERSLARCYSPANGETPDHKPVKGVIRIAWAPPTREDFEQIKALGDRAVPELAGYFPSAMKQGGFEQLIAIKFLEAIGTPATIPVLGAALNTNDWQVARLNALDTLGRMPQEASTSLIQATVNDTDIYVATRARQILATRRDIRYP